MARRDLTDECLEGARRPWQRTGGRAAMGARVRLFRHPVLDALTRSPPWLPYLVVAPIAGWLLVVGIQASSLGPVGVVGAVLVGWLIWTLVEYLMHRFIFHLNPKSDTGRVAIFLVHGHHHVHPDDPRRIVATPIQFGSLLLLFAGISRLVLGAGTWALPWVGFAIGYLGYEAVHWMTHHGQPRRGLVRALKRHHMRHHHVNPRAGWGISSPLWDWVFRTTDRLK